jgi:hypothetical protein
MTDITLAADQAAATKLLHDAETALGTQSTGPQGGSLGPFSATFSASASFSGGAIDLIAPNIIQITNCNFNYSVDLSLSVDLNSILPSFCLPQICIPIPFDGDICTPKICISWPTITIPVSYSDTITFTADFTLNAHLSGATWLVDVVIVGIPALDLSPAAAAILAAIAAAVTPILLAIPFIGPFLALGVDAILAAIGIAGLLGLLGPLLTPFVSGLTFNIYKHPKVFQVLPNSSPIDPAVNINLDLIQAAVLASDKSELVLTANISA